MQEKFDREKALELVVQATLDLDQIEKEHHVTEEELRIANSNHTINTNRLSEAQKKLRDAMDNLSKALPEPSKHHRMVGPNE